MNPNGEIVKRCEAIRKAVSTNKQRQERIVELFAAYVAACDISRIKGPRAAEWRHIAKQREGRLREVLGG